MFGFSKIAKHYASITPGILNQDNPFVRYSKKVPQYESVDKAIYPVNAFIYEVSDMYKKTESIDFNGKTFKTYSKEIHYMYEYVFKELLMKVKMVPAKKVITPQRNEWIICEKIATKYGTKKLF